MFQPRIETAACGHRIQRDILGRDADRAGGGDARLFGGLAGDPQIQPPVGKARGGGGGFERGGIVRLDLITAGHVHPRQSRSAEPGFGNRKGFSAIKHGVEPSGDFIAVDGRGNRESGLHRIERLLRVPPCVGSNRKPAFALDDPGQSPDPGGGIAIEPGQFRSIGWPVTDRGIDHARQAHIACKAI